MATGGAKKKTAGAGSRSSTKRSTASKKSGTAKSAARTSGRRKQTKLQVEKQKRFIRGEVAIILVAFLGLFLFLSNLGLLGAAGAAVAEVQKGLFGIVAYVLPLLLLAAVVLYVKNRGLFLAPFKLICTLCIILILSAIAQLLFGGDEFLSISAYYEAAANGALSGGVVGGVLAGILRVVTGRVGAYLILIALFLICMLVVTERSLVNAAKAGAERTAQAARSGRERYAEYREESRIRRDAEREARKLRQLEEDFPDAYEDEDDFDGTEAVSPADSHKERARRRAETERIANEAHIYAGYGRDIIGEEQPGLSDLDDGTGHGPVHLTDSVDVHYDGTSAAATAAVAEGLAEQGGILTQGAGKMAASDGRYDTKVLPRADQFVGKIVVPDPAVYEEDTVPFEEDHSGPYHSYADVAAVMNLKAAEAEGFAAAGHAVSHSQGTEQNAEPQHAAAFLTEADAKQPSQSEAAFDEPSADFEREPSAGIDRSAVLTATGKTMAGGSSYEINQILREKSTAYGEELPAYSAEDRSSISAEVEGHASGLAADPEEAARYAEQERSAGHLRPKPFADVPHLDGSAAAASARAQVDQTSRQRGTSAAAAPTEAERQKLMGEVQAQQKKPPRPYVFPPLNLLKKGPKSQYVDQAELRETAIKLQQVLQTFGVGVTVTNVTRGPSVTRYEMAPEVGVKVSRITSLQDDIKLALAAADIRIEAPIPGKSAVGIEVPNKNTSMVYFRDLIESEAFRTAKSRLSFGIGRDIQGQPVIGNIAKMPHLLIAGATGSGKSVGINTLIMSLIYKAKPEEVRMIMIDPKVVELSVYNGIPHLLIPVVTDPKKAVSALGWAVAEMMDRYKKFEETATRNLEGYNEKIEQIAAKLPEDAEKPKKLPRIVIVIDELAELMMTASKEVEADIVRLAQLARAAGMHLIIATQRPSVDVITGLIKANIPSRIAFKTASNVDSRTILDMAGAERLLGNGDMLYFPQGAKKPLRVQGAFVDDAEVEAVVRFLTKHCGGEGYESHIDDAILQQMELPGQGAGGQSGAAPDDGRDEYFAEAGRLITDKKKASIGMLQRMYKIGFNRAARVMDQLCEAGVVGEEEGTKPRKVLMNPAEFEAYLAGGVNQNTSSEESEC